MAVEQEFVYNAVNNWIPGKEISRIFFLKLIDITDYEKQPVLFFEYSCASFLFLSEEKGNTHRF
jgi:hypothetical protein